MKKGILLIVLLLSCSEKEMILDEEMALDIWGEINGYEPLDPARKFQRDSGK